MTDLIKVSGLCKRYEGFSLKNVSLSVTAGCVTGFIGSNGAGKTTTIKSILGLTRPDGGSITLFGEPVCGNGAHGDAADATLARAKAHVGVVFDTCPFPGELHASEVECMGRYVFPAWSRASFEESMRRFGIDLKKQVKDLSRGMGMKLQLAFALAHDPQLLVLDEVTAGLDPMARDEVLDILRDFMRSENHGILMSSHITSDLEKIADYVVCIDAGREVFSCTTEHITDVVGVAHVAAHQVDEIVESGVFAPGSLRVCVGGYSCEVLVPDRALLRSRFPQVACDRASIDDYMRLMLKGDIR